MGGSVVTQKCGDDWLFLGTSFAKTSAELITGNFLKSKDRKFNVKQVDSKTSRVAMIGLYSKDTDGQMYTS